MYNYFSPEIRNDSAVQNEPGLDDRLIALGASSTEAAITVALEEVKQNIEGNLTHYALSASIPSLIAEFAEYYNDTYSLIATLSYVPNVEVATQAFNIITKNAHTEQLGGELCCCAGSQHIPISLGAIEFAFSEANYKEGAVFEGEDKFIPMLTLAQGTLMQNFAIASTCMDKILQIFPKGTLCKEEKIALCIALRSPFAAVEYKALGAISKTMHREKSDHPTLPEDVRKFWTKTMGSIWPPDNRRVRAATIKTAAEYGISLNAIIEQTDNQPPASGVYKAHVPKKLAIAFLERVRGAKG